MSRLRDYVTHLAVTVPAQLELVRSDKSFSMRLLNGVLATCVRSVTTLLPSSIARSVTVVRSASAPVVSGRCRSHIVAAGGACLYSRANTEAATWSGRCRRTMVQQCGNAMHVNSIGCVIAAVVLLLPNLGRRQSDDQALFTSLGLAMHRDRLKRGRWA